MSCVGVFKVPEGMSGYLDMPRYEIILDSRLEAVQLPLKYDRVLLRPEIFKVKIDGLYVLNFFLR
jgi:hypothetical protein